MNRRNLFVLTSKEVKATASCLSLMREELIPLLQERFGADALAEARKQYVRQMADQLQDDDQSSYWELEEHGFTREDRHDASSPIIDKPLPIPEGE